MEYDIKGVLMDYGGTIDTNGIHWAEVIYNGYLNNNIQVAKEVFRKAYVYGEQCLEKYADRIKPSDTFIDIMLMKITYHDEYYKLHNLSPKGIEGLFEVAYYCYSFANNTISKTKPVLGYLSAKYPLVLVSNFYGNLNAVLADFGINGYFKSVVESATVNVRKPDKKIFEIGMQQLGMFSHEVAIIGDSYKNDIAPANELGCCSVWLKNIGWESEDNPNQKADFIINDMKKVKDIL